MTVWRCDNCELMHWAKPSEPPVTACLLCKGSFLYEITPAEATHRKTLGQLCVYVKPEPRRPVCRQCNGRTTRAMFERTRGLCARCARAA